jgi:hypothetical protein
LTRSLRARWVVTFVFFVPFVVGSPTRTEKGHPEARTYALHNTLRVRAAGVQDRANPWRRYRSRGDRRGRQGAAGGWRRSPGRTAVGRRPLPADGGDDSARTATTRCAGSTRFSSARSATRASLTTVTRATSCSARVRARPLRQLPAGAAARRSPVPAQRAHPRRPRLRRVSREHRGPVRRRRRPLQAGHGR